MVDKVKHYLPYYPSDEGGKNTVLSRHNESNTLVLLNLKGVMKPILFGLNVAGRSFRGKKK